MAANRIADMTQEELTALIEQTVDRRLADRLDHVLEIIKIIEDTPDPRSLDAVFESITENIWTPPPGARSSVELLRADRDRE